MDNIPRSYLLQRIQQAFTSHRIVCLLGPRQSGKTTVARIIWSARGKSRQDPGYFDLEKPSDQQALESPELVLKHLRGLIVMDEIQRSPELFPYLRYLHDEQKDQQFLILGSASRAFIQQSSESLAGRVFFMDITPFSLEEVATLTSIENPWQHLWERGGFPSSFLSAPEQSWSWRTQYIRSYLEQELSTGAGSFDANILKKLWFMLAHYHGHILNHSELATALGISQPTVSRYIAHLVGSFMIRLLQPWHANLKKRQVKSPKVYYRDTGLLHSVLGIKDYSHIFLHPKAGASFEGFAIEELIKYYQPELQDSYFWASHNQAELDLLLIIDGKKHGFECKMSDAPKWTPSMRIACEDLELDSLTVIYPGDREYALNSLAHCRPLQAYQHIPLRSSFPPLGL